MNKKYTLALFIALLFSSCYEESRLLVNADFHATVAEDNYTAPVKIILENNSTGADFYKWTFDGGEPSESSDKTPKNIIYNQAGTYTIKLEAWNNHERDEKEFTFSTDSSVTIDFDIEVLINDFVPAKTQITNKTVGASEFLWQFEGGEPSESKDQHPENILFTEAGDHKITLIVNNGREVFHMSKIISLQAAMHVGFEIEPSFDDFDYEAPFTASLLNKTTNGLSYLWSSTGGIIENNKAENTNIIFDKAGTYSITLTGENGKEKKSINKEITIKANSNLYIQKDVKFGIKSAASTLGSFYSLPQRNIIPQNEVNQSNGGEIDLVFYAINQSFDKCYFTSPDMATSAGFYPIPNAKKTYIVNKTETNSIALSSKEFDTMTDDTLLKTLDIKSIANTDDWFIANPVPRIVLFETAEGRKGAIKIKAFVSEGQSSYVLTDIKYQKEKSK